MRLKWSIIIPTLAIALVGGAAIAFGLLYLTQPQEAVSEETTSQLEQVADDITAAAPLIQEETQEPLEEETVPPEEADPAPAEEPLEEEIPEKVPPETPAEAGEEPQEETIQEPVQPQEEPLEEDVSLESQEEEEITPEDSNLPQPLDSDLYDLVGSYTSDTGIAVDIQFVDGFYTISLQGMSDSHHTITDNSTGDGTLDLSIVLTNLPFTAQLTRSLDGALTVELYSAGSTTPMLSTTAIKN